MIRKLSIVALLLLAPGPPVVAQDAWRQRAWREQTVAAYGHVTRKLVEDYGDDGCRAICACSVSVGVKLAEFHNSGKLNELPRPHVILWAIGQYGDVVAWHVMRTDLRDLDTCDAFLEAPLDYALGVRSLETGVAEIRARRMVAANAPSVNWFDKRLIGIVGGVLLLGCAYLYWRRRQAAVPGAV